MASTVENLQEAFAGESKANRLYLAFAQKAEEEGFPQVAKLFRGVAEAGTIHALMHLSVLKGVRSTADNLQYSIDEERYEHTSMYPGFIEQAKKDGDINALRSFTLANNWRRSTKSCTFLRLTASVRTWTSRRRGCTCAPSAETSRRRHRIAAR